MFRFLAFVFAVSALVGMASTSHAGGFAVVANGCHNGAAAFGVQAHCGNAVLAAPYGFAQVQGFHHQAASNAFAFRFRQQAAFVPSVNVQVNDNRRRGLFRGLFRGRRGTNVRVFVR